MDQVLKFFFDYWYYIVSIVVSLVSLFVIIFKKNKSKDNSLVAVLEMLPVWILEAESLEDKSQKFSYVFSKAIQYLVSLTGKDEKKVVDEYGVFIDDSIEKILSTPTKKVR